MAQVPILMPQLGESIAEATIIKVLFKEGSTRGSRQRRN